MRKIFTAGTQIALVLTLSGCSGLKENLSKTLGGCNASTSVESFTVNELTDRYNQNAIRFDADLKGKCITVIGAPTDISTTTGYSITLSRYETLPFQRQRYTYSEEGIQVLAHFDKGDAESLQNVKLKGALIRVSGIVGGILDGIFINLDDSKIDSEYSKNYMKEAGKLNSADIESDKNKVIGYKQEELDYIRSSIEEFKVRASKTRVICPMTLMESGECITETQDIINQFPEKLANMEQKEKNVIQTIDNLGKLNTSVCTPGNADDCYRNQFGSSIPVRDFRF